MTIAETGSFQAAAERLFITQSAVSMQMKALETMLQVELFDRTTRPPSLSARGRGLIHRARDLVAEAKAFEDAAAGAGDLAGILVIGVIPSATTGTLPGALQILRDRHPRLQVRVEGGLSTGLSDMVSRAGLDCALVTEADRPPEGLSYLTVLQERLVVVATSAAGRHVDLDPFPRQYDARDATSWLTENPFIRFNRDTGIGRIIERRLDEDGILVNEMMELDSIEAMLQMVVRGLGVAVVPERSITAEFDGLVRIAPFGAPCATRKVGLLVRRRNRDQSMMRALFDALESAAMESKAAASAPE